MKWTDELEAVLIHLRWTSEESANKMLQNHQLQGIVEKLQPYVTTEREKDPNLDLMLTGKIVKNEIDTICKKGKVQIDQLIHRLFAALKAPTGNAQDGRPTPVPLADVSWTDLVKAAKWLNIPLYYKLFGAHPTWGVWGMEETGSDEDKEAKSPLNSSSFPPLSPSCTSMY